jgi:hypothetical protein
MVNESCLQSPPTPDWDNCFQFPGGLLSPGPGLGARQSVIVSASRGCQLVVRILEIQMFGESAVLRSIRMRCLPC